MGLPSANTLKIASDCAAANGILKRRTKDGNIELLPCTFLPSPVPISAFTLAHSLQSNFNLLYDKVSRDHQFLTEVFQPVLLRDNFLARLFDIYSRLHTEGMIEPLALGLNRSDYMMDCSSRGCAERSQAFALSVLNDTYNSAPSTYNVPVPSRCQLRQVEVNLMASGLCGVASKITKQHRIALALCEAGGPRLSRLPDCDSTGDFADAIAQACHLYADTYSRPSGLNLLMVISDKEFNIYDQCAVVNALLVKHPEISVVRRSLASIVASIPHDSLVDSERHLFVDGHEIGVVYFRHGYVPAHFPDEQTWHIKYLMERSLAIKCPSISYMLANTKLVQTALANRCHLSRFIDPTSRDFKRVTSVFTSLHFLTPDLAGSSVEAVIDDAIQNPDEYVLKPQREGGGNNYFGADLVKQLTKLRGTEDLRGYILMQRIYPYTVDNHILGLGESPAQRQTVGELGIFGAFLRDADHVLINRTSGHLLRSKPVTSNEGGVATASGYLDSPFLV